MYRFS